MPKPKKKKVPPCCAIQCCRCDAKSHTHWDGPDACPRWYKGPRNRRPDALRSVSCVACSLVNSYRHAMRTYGKPITYFDAAGQELVENEYDIDRAIAAIDDYDGSFWDTVRLNIERARRNNCWWGTEFREPTAEQDASAAEWEEVMAARERRRAE